MKKTCLWILRPADCKKPEGPDQGSDLPPWRPWYDKCFGMVVRAHTEEDARMFASSEACDEGREAWLDPALSTCEELAVDDTPGVVMRDRWGA